MNLTHPEDETSAARDILIADGVLARMRDFIDDSSWAVQLAALGVLLNLALGKQSYKVRARARVRCRCRCMCLIDRHMHVNEETRCAIDMSADRSGACVCFLCLPYHTI